MYNLYNYMERFNNNHSKIRKIYLFIFAPFVFLIEYLLYIKFWKKIIIPELLTNDNIVAFFEKNEFEYKNHKIWKMDLITSNEFFDRLNIDEAKHVIKKEYVDAISELLSENISTNIEDYITVIVTTELKFVKHEDQLFKDKVYTVIIQFCRYYFFQKAKTNLINWIISIFSLTTLFVVGKLLVHYFV